MKRRGAKVEETDQTGQTKRGRGTETCTANREEGNDGRWTEPVSQDPQPIRSVPLCSHFPTGIVSPTVARRLLFPRLVRISIRAIARATVHSRFSTASDSMLLSLSLCSSLCIFDWLRAAWKFDGRWQKGSSRATCPFRTLYFIDLSWICCVARARYELPRRIQQRSVFLTFKCF